MLKKLQNKKCVISVIVIAALIISVLGITKYSKVQAYEKLITEGNKYMQSENYDKAIESFSKSLDYKKDAKIEDSLKKAKVAKQDKILFDETTKLAKDKKYDEALTKIKSIGNTSLYYSKSQETAKTCKSELLGLANSEIKNHNFDVANKYLDILLKFNANDEYTKKCKTTLISEQQKVNKEKEERIKKENQERINKEKQTTKNKSSNTKKQPSKKVTHKTEKLIGFLGKVYDKSGKRYLTFDSVEFFFGNKAIQEAKKDGKAAKDENGKYFVYDSYYIRNNNETFKTYTLSKDAPISLCVYLVDSHKHYANSATLKSATYDTLKTCSNNNQILCYITIKDNEVINIKQQYIP